MNKPRIEQITDFLIQHKEGSGDWSPISPYPTKRDAKVEIARICANLGIERRRFRIKKRRYHPLPQSIRFLMEQGEEVGA